eukprot:6362580-Amphidinium_carterae.1
MSWLQAYVPVKQETFARARTPYGKKIKLIVHIITDNEVMTYFVRACSNSQRKDRIAFFSFGMFEVAQFLL